MWHDLGTAVGCTAWLLMALVMMTFWAMVVVGLWMLLRFSWTVDRHKSEAPSVDGLSAEPRRRR